MPILSLRSKTTSPLLVAVVFFGSAFMANDIYVSNKADINSLFASNDAFVRANIIEGFFWIAIGVGFGIYGIWQAIKQQRWRILPVTSATTLIIFGFSDFIEAHTGAWWRPLPLLLWKVVCVISIFVLFVLYWRNKRRSRNSDPPGDN